MAQKIYKVVVGGVEQRLTSDDEAGLRNAVDYINKELEVLEKQSDVKLPVNTLYLLLSMNLAERLLNIENSISSDNLYLQSELTKMKEHLSISFD